MKRQQQTVSKKRSFHPEIQGLLILGGTLALAVCLITFYDGAPQKNWLGLLGYYIALSLQYLLGLSSYLLLGFSGMIGWKLILGNERPYSILQLIYFMLFLVSSCILLNLFAELNPPKNDLIQTHVYSESIIIKTPYPHRYIRYYLGGVPAYYVYLDLPSLNLHQLLSNVGIGLIFSFMWLISFILLSNLSIVTLCKKGYRAYHLTKSFFIRIYRSIRPISCEVRSKDYSFDALEKSLQHKDTEQAFSSTPSALPYYEKHPQESQKNQQLLEELQEEIPKKDTIEVLQNHPKAKVLISETESSKKQKYKGLYKSYRLPPLQLLTHAKKIDQPTLNRDLKKQAEVLEETLASFGISAKVGKINCGPTITSFEVHPAIGVKVQKIKVLENDIALNLQAKSIRIIAPIPGKAAVGVEIPSIIPQEVGFKEMLQSYQKQPKKLHIPILLGQTVSGEEVMCDLTKMPHCIIAGATGSGKSVCINSVVLSILMNARPDDIKLLLVDPKKVELSNYSHLPHMIAPIITEPHGAYAALNWLVQEMQKRYEILKRLGLRNIKAFNHRKRNASLEEEMELEIPKKMSFIVAIIDEFADLMMSSNVDIETPIARIAQMARAVGIHLVLATQRPSREVITGLIKANFPTRIAFKVASRINSQIILDENGAETLLGNGDLLFLPPGTSQLIRAQGVFVRDEDINRVVSYIERQAPPNYLIKSFDQMAKDAALEDKEHPQDQLYQHALKIVVYSKNASTTFLQRKLKIGYARAASLMDELESRGVIGVQEGSRARKVLLTPDQILSDS